MPLPRLGVNPPLQATYHFLTLASHLQLRPDDVSLAYCGSDAVCGGCDESLCQLVEASYVGEIQLICKGTSEWVSQPPLCFDTTTRPSKTNI